MIGKKQLIIKDHTDRDYHKHLISISNISKFTKPPKPKVREDELDIPMGHLKKKGPPSWLGVPQLSFMAQTIGCYVPYHEHTQSGR